VGCRYPSVDLSSPEAPSEADLRRAHHAEVRASTRETGALGGALVLVAFPLWALFDRVQEPANADRFFVLRMAVELVALGVWVLLCRPRFGTRHAEGLVLILLVVPEAAIAWMVVRVDPASLEPYLLGLSLPVFASAFLLVWRWPLTAATIAVTAVTTALAVLTAPDPVPDSDVATIGFYLGTAAVISLVAQIYRQRLDWREFRTRAALQREQERSRELLGELERLSREDGLTGVANRRCWDDLVGREVARARRSGSPLAVLLCDVDHFKRINDQHGHAHGDAVLRGVADRIAGRVRAHDVVARLGGDELAVLCPDTDLEAATAVAVELHAVLGNDISPGLTVSFGVGALEEGEADPEPVLARADQELYRAKLTRDAVWAGGRRRDAGLAAVISITAPTP
jgi:diguanylate cyclase (GGDEF)-like protein